MEERRFVDMKAKKKILIIGATGMAGHMLYAFLKGNEHYNLYTIVYRKKLCDGSIICDVRDSDAVENVVESIRPDIVVNCVGALISESINNAGNAVLLNSWLPHFLSSLVCKYNSKLIHISTDCVFSGSKGNYLVDDFRDADNVYGRSKALGELINDRDITIRTSIIGPELKENGEGLMSWITNQKGEVNGYTNAFWSGVTTLELAKYIGSIISDFKPGLVQLAADRNSKFKLLKEIAEVFHLPVDIVPYSYYKSDKSFVNSSSYHVPLIKEQLTQLRSFISSPDYRLRKDER